MTNYKTINTKQAQIQQVNEFVVKNKIKQMTKAKKEHISYFISKKIIDKAQNNKYKRDTQSQHVNKFGENYKTFLLSKHILPMLFRLSEVLNNQDMKKQLLI